MSGGTTQPRKKLAIIGGGSSGLISLKYALDLLPDWDVRCFEQSDNILGAWGNPYPGFISTSTKYTTQFACYRLFDADVQTERGDSAPEFFCDAEYGDYLTRFADEFGLKRHIELNCRVASLRRCDGGGWQLTLSRRSDEAAHSEEYFDAAIICTGVAANAKQLKCNLPTLGIDELTSPAGLGHIRDRRIVVIGGGESAVDYANRLARPELRNKVFLSLKSGVRVSPRYHPIRGVPSDFLRNRLMLSIHPDLRNWIGQRFVESRIRYVEWFRRLFPSRSNTPNREESAVFVGRRKEWDHKLTKAAKDSLFNVFHNKSDDFLDAVGEGRLEIVGEAVDHTYQRFRQFDCEEEVQVSAELVVPAIGYRANLQAPTSGKIQLNQFYLGCCHVEFPDLFLVGFARPIIGNIPTISEMQARWVVGLLAGNHPRPGSQDTTSTIEHLHLLDLDRRSKRYPKLDTDAIFPVEMFPYCDQLARMMGSYPTRRAVGSLARWWRMQLEPATTLHYGGAATLSEGRSAKSPVYMPTILVLLLMGLKPLDWGYRLFRGG